MDHPKLVQLLPSRCGTSVFHNVVVVQVGIAGTEAQVDAVVQSHRRTRVAMFLEHSSFLQLKARLRPRSGNTKEKKADWRTIY